MLVEPIKHDPKVSSSFSLRKSTVDLLEDYRKFYKDRTGQDIDKSEVVDQILKKAFTSLDKAFVAWQKRQQDVREGTGEGASAGDTAAAGIGEGRA